MEKTILITGSNSGIGKITAEYFAEKNLKENAGFKLSGNYSKLRKDVNCFHKSV